MKSIIFLLLPLLFTQQALAQDISADQVITLPKLTSTEIASIQNPNEGSIVFNSTEKKMYIYEPNNGWVKMIPSKNIISTNGSVSISENASSIDLSASASNSTALTLPITQTTQAITLDNTHSTVIITGNHNITLPDADTCVGRIYTLKNITNTTISINKYTGYKGAPNKTTIKAKNITVLQSDGTSWQQINSNK